MGGRMSFLNLSRFSWVYTIPEVLEKRQIPISDIDPPDPLGQRGRKRDTFRIRLANGNKKYVRRLPAGTKPGYIYDTDTDTISPPEEEKAPRPRGQAVQAQAKGKRLLQKYHLDKLVQKGMSIDQIKAAFPHLDRFRLDEFGAHPPASLPDTLRAYLEKGPTTYVPLDIANGGAINSFRKNYQDADRDLGNVYRILKDTLKKEMPSLVYSVVRKGWSLDVVAQTKDRKKLREVLSEANRRVKRYAEKNGLSGLEPRKEGGKKGVYLKGKIEDASKGKEAREVLGREDHTRVQESFPDREEIKDKLKRGEYLTEEEETYKDLLKKGLNDSEIREFSDEISDLTDSEKMRGYGSKEMRDRSLSRSVEHANRTGRPGTYVEMDVVNLGGLTKAVGRRKADKYLSHVSQIIRKYVESLSGEGGRELFRHGGDELSAHVTDVPLDEVFDVVSDAARDIQKYVEEEGLDDIPHSKAPKDKEGENIPHSERNKKKVEREPGFGILYSVREISGKESPQQFVQAGETAVENLKGGIPDEYGGSSRSFRSSSSRKRP